MAWGTVGGTRLLAWQLVVSRGPRRNRHCRLVQEGKDCTQGLRLLHHYMLCGALLRVWGRTGARHGRRHQQQLPADRAPQDEGQEETSW